MSKESPVILQVLPAMVTGGVERGTIDIAKAIRKKGWIPLVASSGGLMVAHLEKHKITHIKLPLHRRNPFSIWRNGKRLEKIIRKYEVDIVHARSRAPAWSAWRACKKTRAKFLTTFHGTYNHRGHLKRWYNAVMTRGAAVIAISKHISAHVQKVYGVSKSKIKLIHRGVDLVSFNPEAVSQARVIQLAEAWRLPDDKFIIMMPGRITRWKGQHVLLEALAKIKNEDFYALFVGSAKDGERYHEALEKQVLAADLQACVRFVGDVRDMPAAFMLADVVVSASIDPEGFGRIMAEASAMGRPVIAAGHGGALEIVKNEETGWLFQNGSAADLAKKLKLALDMKVTTRKKMAAAAKHHIGSEFSLEKMQRRTLKVYASLL